MGADVKAAELLMNVEPKTDNQRKLVGLLRDERVDLIGAFGPSGTGKSYLVLSQALLQVLEGKYDKLVLGRPVIGVTYREQISSARSLEVYRHHVLDYLKDLASSISPKLPAIVEEMVENGKIEIADPVFLRGRTFDRSFIFLDDVQNTTIEVVIEAITRLGIKSKLVVAGDPVFQHLYPDASNTAVLAWEILRNEENAEVVDLGIKDVIRPGAKRGLRLLLESVLRRRAMDDTEKLVANTYKLYAPDADIITVINLTDAKKTFEIESENVPDALVIVKPGHVGRAIGTGGERIGKVEEDTGLMLRVVELTLNFKEYFRAIHPVSWIHARIIDADLAGPYLVVKIPRKHLGPMLGQKGAYAKFMEAFLRKTFGVGLRVEEAERAERKR
ncbi:MAG: PhoH family protein [Desulfurococcales archaeon]|nr:PhoH family protein [Desulfurococcales archaeon]